MTLRTPFAGLCSHTSCKVPCNAAFTECRTAKSGCTCHGKPAPTARHTSHHCCECLSELAAVQVVRIASSTGGVISQLTSTGELAAALPAESMMCVGPVAVVGVREGSLWLVDARGQPFMLPISHPGLKARCMAAHGDPMAARLIAEQGGFP